MKKDAFLKKVVVYEGNVEQQLQQLKEVQLPIAVSSPAASSASCALSRARRPARPAIPPQLLLRRNSYHLNRTSRFALNAPISAISVHSVCRPKWRRPSTCPRARCPRLSRRSWMS